MVNAHFWSMSGVDRRLFDNRTRRAGFHGRRRRLLSVDRFVVVLILAVGLLASGVAGLTPAAAQSSHEANSGPAVPNDKTTPVVPVVSHYQQPKPIMSSKAKPVVWPAGSADLTLGT